jgi:hypothetical protein
MTGASGIGNGSIDTRLKDLRRFVRKDEARDWGLDPECYTLAQVANLLAPFSPKRRPLPTLGRSGETRDGQRWDVRCHALNRMLQFGWPRYVRIE